MKDDVIQSQIDTFYATLEEDNEELLEDKVYEGYPSSEF